jgi:hypothetical protein
MEKSCSTMLTKSCKNAHYLHGLLISVNCITLMGSCLGTPARAGSASVPIAGVNGLPTGGSFFVGCQKNSNSKTTVTFQINAAPANPLISVGPVRFALSSVGFLFGIGSKQALYSRPQRAVATTVYKESLVWDGVYDNVEVGGSAFGASKTGTVKYFLGASAYDSNRLIVKCD